VNDLLSRRIVAAPMICVRTRLTAVRQRRTQRTSELLRSDIANVSVLSRRQPFSRAGARISACDRIKSFTYAPAAFL